MTFALLCWFSYSGETPGEIELYAVKKYDYWIKPVRLDAGIGPWWSSEGHFHVLERENYDEEARANLLFPRSTVNPPRSPPTIPTTMLSGLPIN